MSRTAARLQASVPPGGDHRHLGLYVASLPALSLLGLAAAAGCGVRMIGAQTIGQAGGGARPSLRGGPACR